MDDALFWNFVFFWESRDRRMRFHILATLLCGCLLLVRCGLLCLAPKLDIGQMTFLFHFSWAILNY